MARPQAAARSRPGNPVGPRGPEDRDIRQDRPSPPRRRTAAGRTAGLERVRFPGACRAGRSRRRRERRRRGRRSRRPRRRGRRCGTTTACGGGGGRADVPAVPGGADHPRGGGAGAGADPAAGQGVAPAGGEVTGGTFPWPRVPESAARRMRGLRGGTVLDRRENVPVFGKPGSGKTHALCAGRAVGAAGPVGVLRLVPPAGAGPARRQPGPEGGAVHPPAGRVRGTGDRRLGVRAADAGGDGGAVHAAGRAVRAGPRAAHPQPAIPAVDADRREPDNDGRREAAQSARPPKDAAAPKE